MCSVMDGFLPPAPQLLPNPVIRLSSRRCARDIPDFASFLCPLMMRRCVRGCKQNANDDTLLSHRRPVPLPAFVIWQTGRKDSPCRGRGEGISYADLPAGSALAGSRGYLTEAAKNLRKCPLISSHGFVFSAGITVILEK